MSVLIPASFFFTFEEVFDMLRRCVMVIARKTGINTDTTSARRHSIVNMIISEPATVSNDISRSSGP